MNLIFVITKNEIRTFRSNDGKTVSTFHISGEEIFEYDEYYDFAEDLKDKLLAIINMRDLSEVAVDIAYIKGEKRAAEEILREFMPCFRVQAAEFEQIEDYAETAEQMLCITENKSVALEKELDNTKKNLAEAERRIIEIEKKLEEAIETNNRFEINNNELQENLLSYSYENQRCCCYARFRYSMFNIINIQWNVQSGHVFGRDSLNSELCMSDSGYCNHILGTYKVKTTYGRDATAPEIFPVDFNDMTLIYTGRDNWSIRLKMKADSRRKLIILKSENIHSNDIFAVITHPDDSEEAVREWVKTKEGK